MRFSKLRVTAQTREFIQEFGGLDRRPRIAENSFSNMRNLSSDQYPALAPRAPRGVVRRVEHCNALLVKDELAYVSGNKFVYGETEMPLSYGEDVPRQLVSMGAYIVVFPDGMYLNTANFDDKGYFEETVSSGDGNEMKITLCDDKKEVANVGTLIVDDQVEIYLKSATYTFGPSTTEMKLIGVPKEGYRYELDLKNTEGNAFALKIGEGNYATVTYDQSGGENDSRTAVITVKDKATGKTVSHTLQYISSAYPDSVDPPWGLTLEQSNLSGKFVLKRGSDLIDSYLKIECNRFARFENFRDSVVIELDAKQNYETFWWDEFPSGTVSGEFKGGALYVKGILNSVTEAVTDSTCKISVRIVNNFPNMDFVIEAQNRLWGCRCGNNRSGKLVNEIYACELGNFKSWYKFGQISTDSYTASVGADGAFTGAVNFRGYPLFFKENVMYKVYGEYPENFQIVSDTSMGVQRGCEKSLCVYSNTLYYKSPQGLFAYDGSINTRIDTALGLDEYKKVVCGAARHKLWASMQCEEAEYSGIYVYDMEKGMWHREDALQMRYAAQTGNDLLYVDEKDMLLSVRGTVGAREEGQISFFAESGIIGYSTPDSKYVSRLALRMLIPHDGRLDLYIEYNSSNVWEFQGSVEGTGLGTFTLPIVPQRCDHFRFRFEGAGDCRIFGFSKVLENGGRV